jgi:hypothetical protein
MFCGEGGGGYPLAPIANLITAHLNSYAGDFGKFGNLSRPGTVPG